MSIVHFFHPGVELGVCLALINAPLSGQLRFCSKALRLNKRGDNTVQTILEIKHAFNLT